MPLDHTPLDVSQLGSEAQRALSGPMKKMAARGLAPISDPVELVTVLYQLAAEPDAELRADAEKSAAGLPEGVLKGALADGGVDPRVLDFFARRVVAEREPLLELIVQNPAAAPETIADLAARGGARLVDLLAENQRRLLEHPPIIASMYTNPRARMSTVDRAVELAVRNGVKVTGIAAWEEIAGAVLKAPKPEDAEASDAMFAAAALRAHEEGGGEIQEVSEDEPVREPDDVPLSQMTIPQKIRLATLGNAFLRSTLIRDAIRPVALAAIKAPTVTEMEVKKYAGNTSLHEDVIKYIANRRDWTKQYAVKHALVQNPKTPLASSMRLLPHLRERDIRFISKSKGVPSALAAQARKLLTQRKRG